ncbi:MAG TPA: YggT family protein [Longimicrobium sp.]
MIVIYHFLSVLEILIIARVIVSWVASPVSRNPVVQFIRAVTDSILEPIRSILPRTGMFDLSPMVAIFALQLLKSLLGGMIW